MHYTLEMLASKSAFTFVAIATLAIGIAAGTAIFSVLYATLLKPLPCPNARRLCVVRTVLGKEGCAPASGPELQSLADRNKLFEQVGGIWLQTGALTGKSDQFTLGWVTSNLLFLLAPRPSLDVCFCPESWGTAERTSSSSATNSGKPAMTWIPRSPGHAVLLNRQPYTVAGIFRRVPTHLSGRRRGAATSLFGQKQPEEEVAPIRWLLRTLLATSDREMSARAEIREALWPANSGPPSGEKEPPLIIPGGNGRRQTVAL